MSERDVETAIESVDVSRRAAIRDMLIKTSFAAPVVATFAMGGLAPREAHAYAVNQ